MSQCPILADGQDHVWGLSVSGHRFCVACHTAEPPDTFVDWNRSLEPGPVKIDVPGNERKLCEQDAQHLGVGYMVDGKRVHPSRVTVFVLKPGGDND